jgi:hypothetical protein
MRVLVCGSRDWKVGALILETLKGLEGAEVVVEGEAPGAYTLAPRAGSFV